MRGIFYYLLIFPKNQSKARKLPEKSAKTSQKWGNPWKNRGKTSQKWRNFREIPDLSDLYTYRNYFLKQRVCAVYIRVILFSFNCFFWNLGCGLYSMKDGIWKFKDILTYFEDRILFVHGYHKKWPTRHSSSTECKNWDFSNENVEDLRLYAFCKTWLYSFWNFLKLEN